MDLVWATLTPFSASSGNFQNDRRYDAALKDHCHAVKQLILTNRQLIQANAFKLLRRLEPGNDSIGFLSFLIVAWDSVSTGGPDRKTLLDETLRFLLNFDPVQVRCIGQSFRKLLEDILKEHMYPPLITVELVASAMLRLDPSGSLFTSTHLGLAKFAYNTFHIEPALKVLDCDILFYPGMAGQREGKLLCDETLSPVSYLSIETGLTDSVRSTTVLEYNLVTALCYMSRRDWTKAHSALERVIVHPSREKGVSKMMDAAYKKWVLVGLLKDGKEPVLPSHVAAIAKSSFDILGPAYKNVAGIFPTSDVARLKAEVDANRQVWADDDNTNLIREVLSAYQKWQILNLRDVYIQVSVSEVREATLSAETGEMLKSDEETAALIRGMLASGLLKGEFIEGKTGSDSYLRFSSDSEDLPEADFARQIAQHFHNIRDLGKQYKIASDRLTYSKEYVKYVIREQKRSEKDSNDPGIGFDAQIEDEDLMTGILAHG